MPFERTQALLSAAALWQKACSPQSCFGPEPRLGAGDWGHLIKGPNHREVMLDYMLAVSHLSDAFQEATQRLLTLAYSPKLRQLDDKGELATALPRVQLSLEINSKDSLRIFLSPVAYKEAEQGSNETATSSLKASDFREWGYQACAAYEMPDTLMVLMASSWREVHYCYSTPSYEQRQVVDRLLQNHAQVCLERFLRTVSTVTKTQLITWTYRTKHDSEAVLTSPGERAMVFAQEQYLAALQEEHALGKVMQAGLARAGFSSLQEYRGVCARACGQDSSVLSKVLYAHTKVRTTSLQREKLGRAIENWEAAHRAEVFAAEQWRELATFLREDMPALPSLSASGLA